MKLTKLHVQNYKALKDVEVPLTNFGCLIGENNAGKSSVLKAIGLVIPGSGIRFSLDDYYHNSDAVEIRLELDEIDEADLLLIKDPSHRQRIADAIQEGKLTLVRQFARNETKQPQLKYVSLEPKEQRFSKENLKSNVAGRGVELRSRVIEIYPELEPILDVKPTQSEVHAALKGLIDNLDKDDLEDQVTDFPTGLENALKPLLPEVIYIDAVKDVTDEVKTTDSATFGKLLKILLDEIRHEFDDIEVKFREIQSKLSRVFDDSGALVDERIDQVKRIEATIEKFVEESFPGTKLKLEVPVPQVKSILSTANILADDGFESPIGSKGDGLKRTVAFAILRAYTVLRSQGLSDASADAGHLASAVGPRYLLLFEEPELFLYPRAQKQLFRALETFAKLHQVVVTSHSPMFLDAEATTSFVKMRKTPSIGVEPPSAEALPVVLTEVSAKDAFQIICHESNNIAFFARKVVLVEGDSDTVLLPHLARMMNPAWDHMDHNVAFAKVNGKGNIAKYQSFFGRFDIDVHVICDLDVLTGGFNHISPNASQQTAQSDLLQQVQSEISSTRSLNSEDAKRLSNRGDARALWQHAKFSHENWDGSEPGLEAIKSSVDAFFAFASRSETLAVLKRPPAHIGTLKNQLLDDLSNDGVHILRRGSLEDYYPSAGAGKDKVAHAMAFCRLTPDNGELALALGDDYPSIHGELDKIMSSIFS